MTEREKVIKGLECCISKDDRCDECPYMTGKEQIGEIDGEPVYTYECDKLTLSADALTLLGGAGAEGHLQRMQVWPLPERGMVLLHDWDEPLREARNRRRLVLQGRDRAVKWE